MKTFLFFSNKGGVGKTSLCAQVAFILRHDGVNVLCADLDSQQNLSQALEDSGIKVCDHVPNRHEVIGHDCILMDSHPVIDDAARRALSVSDYCIAPVTAGPFCLGAIDAVQQTINANRSVCKILCIPVNFFRSVVKKQKEILDILKDKVNGIPVVTVPLASDVEDATLEGMAVSTKSKSYKGLKEISELIKDKI